MFMLFCLFVVLFFFCVFFNSAFLMMNTRANSCFVLDQCFDALIYVYSECHLLLCPFMYFVVWAPHSLHCVCWHLCVHLTNHNSFISSWLSTFCKQYLNWCFWCILSWCFFCGLLNTNVQGWYILNHCCTTLLLPYLLLWQVP